VIQGEGGVAISAGSLEVASALEASSIKDLTVAGGALTGPAKVTVTGSFVGGASGELAGSGSTVIKAGATGLINPTEARFYLVGRTLKNEGSLTVGLNSGLQGVSHAQLVNTGTFTANGEPSGRNLGVIAGEGEATLINTGTLRKTEGTGTTVIGFAIDNEGIVSALSGKLEFTEAGSSEPTSVTSWSASGTGTGIVFNLSQARKLALGASVAFSGSIEVLSGHLKAGIVEGSGASLDLSAEGSASPVVFEVYSGVAVSTIEDLEIGDRNGRGGAELVGGGEVLVTGAFAGGEFGVMSGSGTTVIEPGAVGSIAAPGSTGQFYVNHGRTLVNEGTLTLGKELGIESYPEGGHIVNYGTFNANSEYEGFWPGEETVEKKEYVSTLTNYGTFRKKEGSGKTRISWYVVNDGPIIEETGEFEFVHGVEPESGELWGSEANPSAPEQEGPTCAESVNCASGNFSQSQADFAVGGRGVGLDLTRNYNSQAAAAGVHGVFGYGWSSSFSDHLELEPSIKLATLVQADGSSVPFTEGTGGAFSAPVWSQDTLSGSAGSGYTLTLEDRTVYKFAGSSGRLESVTDRNGNQTTLGYSSEGRLESITDPDGRKITLAYNAEGLVASATDPMKHEVKYIYEAGNLATVTQPGETALRWQFKYNGSHELTEMVDGRGGKTLTAYNGLNQVSEQTDPLGRKTTFEYTPFHTRSTNHATGAVTDEHFSSSGERVSITKGYGTTSATTEYSTYDAAGKVLSTTDGDGYTTRYGYDEYGNRDKLIDPDEHETKWTYDATHDVHTMTKPDGETETIERNADGDPETISRPAPGSTTQTTKYTYDAHGDETSMEDPLKRVWKYEYDGAGDRTAEIDPEKDERTWKYNEDSQETSMVSPRGHASGAKESEFTTTTERDAQGRPLKVTDPLGHETKYTYDGDGNLETVTDPEGHKTTYTYDADNERTKVEEPNKTITETEYDGAGQVKKQIDGDKHATEYVRNVLEQVTEVIDPLGRKTLKEYDKDGNLISVTDALKRVATYKYDPDDRLIEISYSDGKTPTVKYEYNGDGERTKMIDGTGTTTYEYDQLDRLTATKDGHGDTTGYEYDLANEQTKLTYPNGKVIEREYDKAGRLKSTTDWSKNTTKFAYDADSDLTATTFPSATSDEDTYKYDDSDAMTEVKMKKSSETLASLAYTRNKDELVEKTTSKSLPGEEKPAYTYDKNNRLTKGAGIPYEYDAANNPTTIGTEHTYSYNAADELEKSTLKKANAAKYTFNEAGERTKTEPTSGPATTYGYDQAGNLTTVTRPKGTETAAIEDSYAYNGDGLRTSETIFGTTTYLAWDLAENLPLILNDGVNSYIYGPGGLPVEQINTSTGTVLYLHHDQQGSTRLLTSSTGKTEATFTYDAYGNQTGHTGTATTPLGYDGQYTNADTGLIYLRTREYDPATGQFMSVDPAVATTLSPYTYAKDNPLNNSDPSGLSTITEEESAFAHKFSKELARSQQKLGHNYSHARELWHEILIYGFYKELVEIGERGEETEAFRIHLKSLEQQYARISRAVFSEIGKLEELETGLSWTKAVSLIYSVAKEVL
jgi:RHS repeat-associated protein